jgi:hypothetical protein
VKGASVDRFRSELSHLARRFDLRVPNDS